MSSTNTFFTSDTHFNHANALKFDKAPFTSMEEKTETIIERWNSVVRCGDIVYHLGDFALTSGKGDGSVAGDILRRLNGQKFLVAGNHDRAEVVSNTWWVGVYQYREITVKVDGSRQKICAMHYPLRSWNCGHHGAWMLHGHCHGNLPYTGGLILDVGCMNFDYYPISVSTVADIMCGRTIKTEDHHQHE